MTDFRALCARMADELDHYRQLLMDDRRETHALAVEARVYLAQSVTSMTELSPAALAVWEAFNEDVPGVFIDYGDCLAAALRAAADHCHAQKIREADHTTRQWICVDDLLAIADELEAQ
jgi:hypothetical protein